MHALFEYSLVKVPVSTSLVIFFLFVVIRIIVRFYYDPRVFGGEGV